MANNQMFLVNRKTGARVCLAKYYPSSGWFVTPGLTDRLGECFDKSDFGHLTPDQRAAKDACIRFGEPYANYDAEHLMFGDQWELEYAALSTDFQGVSPRHAITSK